MRAKIEFPETPDPLIELPMKFIQGWVNGDTGAAAYYNDASEVCEDLRRRHAGAAYVFHLSGLVAFCGGNSDAGMRFWGRALSLDPEYAPSWESLEDAVETDPDWPSVEIYLDALNEGEEQFLARIMRNAREQFDEKNYAEADRLCQRVSAFKRPKFSQLWPYAECREKSEKLYDDNLLSEKCQILSSAFEEHWSGVNAADIEKSHAEWGDLPDRRQLAQLVAGTVAQSSADPCRIFEIGCLAGFNLHMVKEAIGTTGRREILYGGLEPNAAAVAEGERLYPWIEFVNGSVQDMIAGTVEIPQSIEICLVSRVFMILHPDIVDGILAHIGDRVTHLVICDDIMNTDRSFPVLRLPLVLALHPYPKILGEAGFEITDMVLADVPDRECTGFIIARRMK